MTAPVLSVRDLAVEFRQGSDAFRAVAGVSFDVMPGETLAIVGESGCGRTVTSLAILGLLPRPEGRVVAGEVRFDGRVVSELSGRQLRRFRGDDISMIFQEPASSLNPLFTILDQIADVLRAHRSDLTRRAAHRRAVDLLVSAGVPEVTTAADAYPHEWSGGMCQRAMIAMAMANKSTVLIADEPTTGLDVTIQAEVLAVLGEAQKTANASTVLGA